MCIKHYYFYKWEVCARERSSEYWTHAQYFSQHYYEEYKQ
jgi:hypothetical protein